MAIVPIEQEGKVTPENIRILREWMPRGSIVYTVLRHVSRSGMMRIIGLVTITPDEKGGVVIRHPNYYAAQALGRGFVGNRDGIKVHGAGMDMGFELVYSLSQKLYGDGYALDQKWL